MTQQPCFFKVNDGTVNCVNVAWQAELPLHISQILGKPVKDLGPISGLDLTAPCLPSTPSNPLELYCIGGAEIMIFHGDKYVVVPITLIKNYVNLDKDGWLRPFASNYTAGCYLTEDANEIYIQSSFKETESTYDDHFYYSNGHRHDRSSGVPSVLVPMDIVNYQVTTES